MDNVEEAADSLDTNDDFTIMYTTNTVEYKNVNVFEIVWTSTACHNFIDAVSIQLKCQLANRQTKLFRCVQIVCATRRYQSF